MEDELLCGVCRDMYVGGKKEPVVLPSCGHAFCRSCLLILEEESRMLGRCFSCPTCRAPHGSSPVLALPTTFALLHLSESYRKSQMVSESTCASHGSKVEFWCCDCRSVLCGHCLLEGHVKDGHDVQATLNFISKQQRDVQTTGAWLKWKLNQEKRTLLREMAGLVTRLVCIAHQSQVLHDLGLRMTKILEEADQATTIEGMLLASTLMRSLESEVRTTVSRETTPANRMLLRCRSCTEGPKSTPVATPRPESISEADWMESPMKKATGVEDSGLISVAAVVGGGDPMLGETNTSLRQEEVEAEAGNSEDGMMALSSEDSDEGPSEEMPYAGRECTWPVQCMVTAGEGRQGRLSCEGGRVHVYALTNDDKGSHLLLQLPFLRSLNHNIDPEVFLDLATEERLLGRMYIKLWGHLRRAHHFLSLCMGTHGPSYRGSKFHGVAKKGCMGEALAGGKHLVDGTQDLIAGLEWGGQYIREKVAGLVVAASAGSPEQDAFFHICTRDHPGRKFACAFGEVCSGMDVVHTAVSLHPSHVIKINDCGLVFPRPPGVRADIEIHP